MKYLHIPAPSCPAAIPPSIFVDWSGLTFKLDLDAGASPHFYSYRLPSTVELPDGVVAPFCQIRKADFARVMMAATR